MKQISLSSFYTGSSAKKRKRHEAGRTVLKTVDNSKFASCPLCQMCFPMHVLISHAGTCNGKITEAPEEEMNPAGLAQVADTEVGVSKDDTSQAKTETTKDSTPWWTQPTPKQRPLAIDNPINPNSEPIPGLHLFHDFITEQEEKNILAELDGTAHAEKFLPWQFARFNGPHRGKRWGVHCNLRDRRVGAAENGLPPFYCEIILPKLQKIQQMKGCTPNEANAIEYSRKNGDYLTDHVDDRQLSKEHIANLSIAGDCYMTFINQKKNGVTEPLQVLLPRRTLQVLTGKARYDYSHGIRNQDLLTDRRVSVTMRESPVSKTRQVN